MNFETLKYNTETKKIINIPANAYDIKVIRVCQPIDAKTDTKIHVYSLNYTIRSSEDQSVCNFCLTG